MADDNDGKWHADFRIPVALVFAIALQTATGVWWAATTDSRIGVLERWVEDNKKLSEDIAIVRTNQENIKNMLLRIEQRLPR